MGIFRSFARIDRSQVVSFSAFTVGLAGLYSISLINYLLFHSLAEIFSIIIGCSTFIIAWHSRERIENKALLFIGIAFLFVSLFDILHTLAFKGMGVFAMGSADPPTQLWIASRYLLSISILIAPAFLRRKFNIAVVTAVFAVVTILSMAAIVMGYFPAAYVDGVGLTPFKIISEYIISLILVAATIMLVRSPGIFDREVRRWMISALVLSIASELAFTSYISVYGFTNALGHIFKILAYFFIYKAIVGMGLERPHRLLFRELKQNESALQNALHEVQRLADTDSLTGLHNHRRFLELAEREVQVSQRYKHPLAAIMVDIDHFKSINDTHGHLAGDRLLQAVADIFRKETRRVDVLGRFGGDEFMLLLPETGIESARQKAEAIRRLIEKISVNSNTGPGRISATLGVATLKDGSSLEDLLDLADQALYEGKHAGRNQVGVCE